METIDVAAARVRGGLRLGLVAGAPSPWGEAARCILDLKRIPWVAVPYRGSGVSREFEEWTGTDSAPVAKYENERARSHWADILALAERLAPQPALVPSALAARVRMFGLCQEICGESGLGWSARLLVIDAALNEAGYPLPREAGAYFAAKYGYQPHCREGALSRVREVLGALHAELVAQAQRGQRYYIGEALTALDVYAAAFSVLYAPWPPEHCAMSPGLRECFSRLGQGLRDAVTPELIAHRDFVYAQHLGLPVAIIA